jgi:hypothetical protein
VRYLNLAVVKLMTVRWNYCSHSHTSTSYQYVCVCVIIPSQGPVPTQDYTHRKNFDDPRTKNSVAVVRKRTIPTEQPLHVVEVSANFCG